MNRLTVYTLLATFTLCSVGSLEAGPIGEEEVVVDDFPEERYTRERVYEREYRYKRETIVERGGRYDDPGWCDPPVLYSGRPRSVYFIEDDRPVRRAVYVSPRGGYYRIAGGRRAVVRRPYFNSYPSRYFYPDARRRVGVRFSFP